MENNIVVGNKKQYIEKVIDKAINIIQFTIENSTEEKVREKLQILYSSNDTARHILDALSLILSDTPSGTLTFADFQLMYYKGDFSIEEERMFISAITQFIKDKVGKFKIVEKEEYLTFISTQESEKIIKRFLKQEQATLRVHIKGRWYLRDMEEFCRSISDISTILIRLILLVEHKVRPLDMWLDYDEEKTYKIKTIRYASPGVFDVLGLGKVFEELSSLIQKIILWRANLRAAKLDIADKEITSLVGIWEKANKLDLDETMKNELKENLSWRLNSIMQMAEAGRISGSRVLPKQNKQQK